MGFLILLPQTVDQGPAPMDYQTFEEDLGSYTFFYQFVGLENG